MKPIIFYPEYREGFTILKKMKFGEFKAVSRGGEIIGFIHLRFDGAYEATAVYGEKTKSDSLDDEEKARKFIIDSLKK